MEAVWGPRASCYGNHIIGLSHYSAINIVVVVVVCVVFFVWLVCCFYGEVLIVLASLTA